MQRAASSWMTGSLGSRGARGSPVGAIQTSSHAFANVLAPNGDYVMDFNSAGMFRGVKQEGGEAKVAIYGE